MTVTVLGDKGLQKMFDQVKICLITRVNLMESKQIRKHVGGLTESDEDK